MLVLGRDKDESIIIDGSAGRIEIMIVEVRSSGKPQVRLGINAPKHISVHRKEIQDAIDREKSLSSQRLLA